ncbi:MAG TPA: hypothetical protein VFC05_10805 [Nitrososphaeraceae archaeon]|nr:hypothetical protein [Nitrososphaeraceae archaeon]
MMINGIKFYLISAVVPLLFLIPSFNIDGFGLVNGDVPQDLEYGINFKYLKNWKLLPEFEIDTNDDLSTTSYTLAEKDSIYNYKGKSFYGYLISIKVIDDLLVTSSSEQWAKNQILGISKQSISYRLIEPSDPNGELLTLPISQGKYKGYTYTIEDKTTQKINVNTVLVLDNKRYEFEYTSPNINNEVAYRYIDDYKEILNSIKFTDS